ncbi:DUF2237 domain-containing protein [Halomonas sp. BC2]|nr:MULTISPECIES: DUF2237 domain-containing protein [unclassified Halomonas]
MSRDLNVLGEPLTPCCHSPKTGGLSWTLDEMLTYGTPSAFR